MAIGVKVMERPIEDVSYIRATIKGMAQTFRHLFEPKVTVQYPETKYPISPRWRGTQRMLTTETGQAKCVACGLSDHLSGKLHQADSRGRREGKSLSSRFRDR
jgi:NADH-quinone oxidoreductase subunit I